MKEKDPRKRIEKEEALQKFLWLLQYFQKEQLQEIYLEEPDGEFFLSGADDWYHLESVLLLDKDGETLCEVGVEIIVLPMEKWCTHRKMDMRFFPERVFDALDRLDKKAEAVSYALIIQNADTAFIFSSPPETNFLEHSIQCTHGRTR